MGQRNVGYRKFSQDLQIWNQKGEIGIPISLGLGVGFQLVFVSNRTGMDVSALFS
ncbi:hypothetical protein [Leptospira borgpetersenii]|uniref:hypothetical protein n=1 Tax=Leptospira borgpetersenii TaxID=174 RepID=UPI002020CA16|nr:hypothetical protein [Leptospira borgpetersenii]URD70557.1 hypothetical protein LIX26_03335 [Leptospira borgpetersenii]UVD73734.1 hypothetical protein NU962_03330 [Leptospira borgpetersenii]UVD76927.1 hypothetical protein LIX27_03340 [Leptospira borgpetersenii]UZW33486.1 hypothetical protein OR565_03330 [Leptospira borgpetersenii]